MITLTSALAHYTIDIHKTRGGGAVVAFQTAQGMEVRRVLRTLGYRIMKTTHGVLPFVWYFNIER